MKRTLKTFLTALAILPILSIFSHKVTAGNATLEFKHDTFEEGIITTHIYLNTSGASVNGVTADFTYPSDLLEVTELSTDNMLFIDYIENDYSQTGIVYISCYSIEGINGEGNIATVKFKTLQSGEAVLKFTDDILVLEAENSENILSEAKTGTYTINENLSTLPQTGSTPEVLTGLIALIAIVMILIFTIAGFTMWGGIYFSLGKWELNTEGSFEVGGKGKKKTKKRTPLKIKAASPKKKIQSKKSKRK